MITEDYVSFETAKLLKEKGFDKEVLAVYIYDNLFVKGENKIVNTANMPIISAPTLQMAMKWLREEHNIDIIITIGGFIEKGKVYFCSVYRNLIKYGDLKECSTYEQAVETAIKYSLENLI